MKILLANNHFANYGGADVFTYETGQLLRKNNHDVFFFASNRGPFFEDNYVYGKYFPEYVKYKELPKTSLIKNALKPLYNIEAEKKLDLFIKEVKPDIAHFNCINYHLTPSVINACYKNNTPVVVTLHDTRSLCPSGTLMKNGNNYCATELCVGRNPLPCIINKCKYQSLIASALVSMECILNNIYRINDKTAMFISPSSALLELAIRAGMPRNKLVHINNFINDSFFQVTPENTNKGYFLFAGRLVKEKGIDILIKTMTLLPEIELHLVGTGKEEENLKSLAKDLKLTNIKFLGFKSGEELKDEYKGCIATIIPSNYFEIFGLTIVESFAYGKPVIGSNLGAIPEIIKNEETGLIFSAGNIYELAEKLQRLYLDKNLVNRMGQNARLIAESTYNSQTYYNQLIQVYRQLIEPV